MNRTLTRVQQNDRGTLLIIALLIILVLSGLALIGVRTAIMESRQVGNYRSGEQSSHITQSGLTSVLALAVSKGDAFPEFVKANNYVINMTDVADPFFDTKIKGSFGYEYVNVGSGTNVNFVAKFTQPVDTNKVPGYPVNDQFVWKKYRITAYGYFGDQVVDINTPDSTLRNSTRSYVSYTYVGPYIMAGGQ